MTWPKNKPVDWNDIATPELAATQAENYGWNERGSVDRKAVEAAVSEENLRVFIFNALTEEAIRNGRISHDRDCSKFCSCELCHTSDITAKAVHEQITSVLFGG